MKMDDKISVRVPCPVCDEWLDVDVEVRRGLVIEQSAARVAHATLLLAVDEESAEALVEEHGCFTATAEDQAALDAAVDEAAAELGADSAPAAPRKVRF